MHIVAENERMDRLEREIGELRSGMEEVRQQFSRFREQFE